MLTTFQGIMLIVACPLFALLCLVILNWLWPLRQRRVHNDVIGVQVVVLGTIYAVVLGFMLFAVWTSYLAADVNAEAEANSLVSIFRLADGLPATQRDQIHRLANEYANTVIEQEWPQMHKGELGLSGQNTIQRMWTAVLQSKVTTLGEQASMEQALYEISVMTEHRRVRQHDSEYTLPRILWMVLIVGGIITMLSYCMFGIENFSLHCVHVVSLTLIFTLILVAIAEVDHPFQGTVHISPRGFERARATFAQIQ